MLSNQPGKHKQINTLEKSFPNTSLDDNFYDDDVQRYEADSYKLKYGDRWKRLASSVRDVRQTDGTVIREYIIDDPSLLDNLSEDEQQKNSPESCQHLQFSKDNQKQHTCRFYTNHDTYSHDNQNIQNTIQASISRCTNLNLDNNSNEKKTFGSNQILRYLNRPLFTNNICNQENSIFQKAKSKSTYNLTDRNNLSTRCFKPIKTRIQKEMNFNLVNSNKLFFKSDDEEFDKEIESIHEQGEQLKQYSEYVKDLPTKQSDDFLEQNVEYEILDEHGNQIFINNAQDLKELATSVSEVVQADGSIVKEYILNDPKIIERIRNKIKSESVTTNTALNSDNLIQVSSNMINKSGNEDQRNSVEHDQFRIKYPASNNILTKELYPPDYLSKNKKGAVPEKNTIKTNETDTTNTKNPLSAPVPVMDDKFRTSDNAKRYESITDFLQLDKNDSEKHKFFAGNTDSLFFLNNHIKPPVQYENVSVKPYDFNRSDTYFNRNGISTNTLATSNNNKNLAHLPAVPKYENVNFSLDKTQNEDLAIFRSPSYQSDLKKINSYNLTFDQSATFEHMSEDTGDLNISDENKHKKSNLRISNQFEFRSKKGKTLKLMITSQDITESDVEECKTLLDSRYDSRFQQSLLQSEQQLLSNKFSENKTNFLSYNTCDIMKKGNSESQNLNAIMDQSSPKQKIKNTLSNNQSHLTYRDDHSAVKKVEKAFPPLFPSNTQHKCIDNGTYSKSTSNLIKPGNCSYKRDFSNKSFQNKSVENLNDNEICLKLNVSNITTEMTQNLVLQLLLEQINSNIESEIAKKKSQISPFDSSALYNNQRNRDAKLKLSNSYASKNNVEELSDFEDSLLMEKNIKNNKIDYFKRSNSKKLTFKKFQSHGEAPDSFNINL